MIWIRSVVARGLRILASKLDDLETVQVNHINIDNDIHVYTTFDADPAEIAAQISAHMGLYP